MGVVTWVKYVPEDDVGRFRFSRRRVVCGKIPTEGDMGWVSALQTVILFNQVVASASSFGAPLGT